jgi:hypothetical protein
LQEYEADFRIAVAVKARTARLETFSRRRIVIPSAAKDGDFGRDDGGSRLPRDGETGDFALNVARAAILNKAGQGTPVLFFSLISAQIVENRAKNVYNTFYYGLAANMRAAEHMGTIVLCTTV